MISILTDFTTQFGMIHKMTDIPKKIRYISKKRITKFAKKHKIKLSGFKEDMRGQLANEIYLAWEEYNYNCQPKPEMIEKHIKYLYSELFQDMKEYDNEILKAQILDLIATIGKLRR